MKRIIVACLALSASLAAQSQLAPASQLPPAAAGNVDYDTQVKPLLAQNCYGCHGPSAQQAGLRLDLRQNALRGGDYGPVIIPGKSADSKLIKRLVDGDGGMQMPPTGPLTPEEIGILGSWIDQGAEFRTDVVESPVRPTDPELAAAIAAVRSEPRSVVEKLVAADQALLTETDAAGSTLLHHAAGFGTLDTLRYLIDAGANVNATNARRSTPLHWAIHDEAKVRLLVSRGANVNARQVEGITPLYMTALLGRGTSTMKFLLEHAADPTVAMANGQTPLMAAAVNGRVESMKLLLDRRDDVNTKNGAGETALMFAATNGNPEAVKLLLDRGADAKVRTKRNETALGNASTAGVEASVRLLLDRGAEVNVRNIRGFTALMFAASSDTVPERVVKLLLDHGAEASYTDDDDETAHDLAAKRGDTAVTQLLRDTPRKSPVPAVAHVSSSASLSPAQAVEKAMVLLEKQSYNFIRISGCNSCHSQDLPSAAAAFARNRGVTAPREIAQLPPSMTQPPERVMDLNVVSIAGLAWELFDAALNSVPRNAFTDAVVRAIKATQTPEGLWSTNESRRPPMNAGDFQATALAIHALKHYTPPLERPTTEQSIAHAVRWLEQATPEMTQDRAFHALGIAWANDGSQSAAKAARALAALQRPDGGWGQMPLMESDAYATGQALYALHVAGKVPPDDPVYRRGIGYLLRTQAADGTWHVRSRSIWLQPYFESGFPYGQDQFISTAGTAWAAIALSAAGPPRTTIVARSRADRHGEERVGKRLAQ